MRLGATHDGKLLSLAAGLSQSHLDAGQHQRKLWRGNTVPLQHGKSAGHVGTRQAKRRNSLADARSRSSAWTFAVESAMDELAIKLQMDPVELRLRNDTLIDEENNKPFSSRHLKECYQVGAEKFGWSQRTPAVGSMRKGDLILGWGMAAASWGAGRGACQASVTLKDDGSAYASCATQDIGTGTYTVFAQVVRERTGIRALKD